MKPRNNIDIIKAELSHANDILKIENECFSTPWAESSIKESIENKNSTFIVAKIDNKIVGYVGFYIVADESYLYNIAVLKDYRRLAIGSTLLTTVIKMAESYKAEFISLEVRCSNFPAVELYKSLGFKKVGLRKGFYNNPTEDAVIMTKYLNTDTKGD